MKHGFTYVNEKFFNQWNNKYLTKWVLNVSKSLWSDLWLFLQIVMKANYSSKDDIAPKIEAGVNLLCYQEDILDWIFEEEIAVLDRKVIKNVQLHMDKVSSHSFKSTVVYLEHKPE